MTQDELLEQTNPDRRCCHKGCERIRKGWKRHGEHTVEYGWNDDDGWYRPGIGFMTHVCPDHRGAFEAYNKAADAASIAFDKAYRAAAIAFEEQWEKDNPHPTHSSLQSSTDW